MRKGVSVHDLNEHRAFFLTARTVVVGFRLGSESGLATPALIKITVRFSARGRSPKSSNDL